MNAYPRGPSYGPHLIADLAGCSCDKTRDGQFVYEFMQTLVRQVGMNPIGSPHLDLYTGPHKEWEGWSATVHIQTSHVTAHFFAFGYVFLDVFSCRPFDVERTKQYIVAGLEPSISAQFRELERGYNFPEHLVDPEQIARFSQLAAEVGP